MKTFCFLVLVDDEWVLFEVTTTMKEIVRSLLKFLRKRGYLSEDIHSQDLWQVPVSTPTKQVG